MKTRDNVLQKNGGFSLLEVLIAMFLSAVVLIVIFKVFVTQHYNWSVQEQIIDMQQNARAAIDEITRQVRMAGHDLPLGLPGIIAYNTNPDTIIITYGDGGCDAPIEHTMPLPSAELRCDGHDISCFYSGQHVYIFHPDSGGGEFFQISLVQTAAAHIQHNKDPLSKCYAKGAIVIALQRIKYFIDNSDTLHPNLMMQLPGQSPQVYSENIEDLQFVYTMKNGILLDAPAIIGDIRQVQVTMTARTNIPDPEFPDDPYRRRQYTSRVNLRNFDI